MENGDLTFSTEGKKTRAVLYDGYNDINVFVEDKKIEYLYEIVFQRLLGNDCKISAIFPCGTKHDVIKSFEEFGEQTNGTKNIYLVDGEFDSFLFPDKMINNSHFIYLKKYNLESYLINEKGATAIVKYKLGLLDTSIPRYFSFSEWKTRITDEAKDLYFCYCYIKKYSINIKSVDRSYYEFLDKETGYKRSDGSFENFRQNLYDTYPDSENLIEEIKNDFERRFGNQYDKIICGKFLMASLFARLHKVTGKRIDSQAALWGLVDSFDTSELDYVRDACLSN